MLATMPATAQELSLQLTNLTHGSHFTPLMVSAHTADQHIFSLGESASLSLQAMAEGGDISGLVSDLSAVNADIIENPAGGLTAPGQTLSFDMSTQDANTNLSLSAMILPSNDGFTGVDSLAIPTQPGTYTYYLNAYDAGTEANDEIVNSAGAPGETLEFTLTDNLNLFRHLSLAGMLVNTNDGFSGLNGIELRQLSAGHSSVYYSRAYDAGTEFNSELAGTIPGPADAGEGFNSERDDVTAVVTLHSGVVTADDNFANSTLSQAEKFDNPTLRIVITAL